MPFLAELEQGDLSGQQTFFSQALKVMMGWPGPLSQIRPVSCEINLSWKRPDLTQSASKPASSQLNPLTSRRLSPAQLSHAKHLTAQALTTTLSQQRSHPKNIYSSQKYPNLHRYLQTALQTY